MTSTNKASRYRWPDNYDYKDASDAAAYTETSDSLTVQSLKDDADVNVIVKRFLGGQGLPANIRTPTYGDFEGISDYQTALQAVLDAQENFMQVPAEVRAQFENDPQRFLDYCSQEANWAQMKQWGMVTKGPPEPPGAAPNGGYLGTPKTDQPT